MYFVQEMPGMAWPGLNTAELAGSCAADEMVAKILRMDEAWKQIWRPSWI